MVPKWMILSYGNFSKTKKLFSYDKFGRHTIPIFTDILIASEFKASIDAILDKNKALSICYCNDQQLADILDFIIISPADVTHVIQDPKIPQNNNAEQVRIGENIKAIYDFRETLQNTENQNHTQNTEPA